MIQPRDLPLLAVFAAIGRHRSFTLAARELGYTKSMVSAQLRALETKLGVRLVDRTTRSVRLTSAGAAAFEAAQRMLGEARNALESAGALRQEPAGKLRISVPHGLAASIVAPLAAELVRAHARLSLEIVADDELRDLLRDELDVAVRMAAPRDSAYVMRRLGTSPVILVGSPRLDLPPARSPSELERAPWVRHTLVDGERWTFTGPHQQKETIVPVWRAAANTMDAFRSLLLAGAGIGAIPELHVIDDLRRGTLQRVCPGWVKRHVVVYGLVASRQSPPHLQLFLAALRAALRQAGLE